MADNADHPIALAQSFECVDHDIESVVVEVSEALVDKDRLKPAGGDPGELSQPDREREGKAQRGKEGLAARRVATLRRSLALWRSTTSKLPSSATRL